MKILLIHCFYQLKGGEDSVFEQEYALLANDNEVETLVFKNKNGWRGGWQFFISIWNFSAQRKVKNSIKNFRPNVIHLHNWHFGCGPVVIRASKKMNVPIVLTLHNYRLLCPSGTLLNKGALFTNSLNVNFPWKAVFKKVYRNSYIQTLWLAFIVWFHKKINTWQMVDKYIVLTSFSQQLISSSLLSINKEKLVVKPNFISGNHIFKIISRKAYFLFVGRLSEEKGIQLLLDVFKENNEELHIAGTGPLLQDVKKAAATNNNICYLGALSKEEVAQEMKECTAVLFSSIWYEPFGLVSIEAFALSTAVIASNLGATATIIQHGYNGLHFIAGDKGSLQLQINNWVSMDLKQRKTYYSNAFKTYKDYYTDKENKKKLMEIYQLL